ncbi:ATP-dependent nuclease [Leptospira vanthielii]|uniref:AAA domain protein n=1 Tax=Leptospira vanthielii serovar Holland str. Waz Holland = ATCC 700522 TaxID=1218591 RepID=N1W3H2_9LEPT|nr:AAA family ATPase [Leptospira vanthielii]EMY67777.1 AAA domain protein [Leptospira vanthielii serovar Holland str. Waz Holland = ATCC 700522]
MPPAKKAKQKETIEETSLESSDPTINKPRLRSLSIKNFRSIGNDEIKIDLDDIVVLVGPNNAGKSSILRAYELVMKHGSKECQLAISDFPSSQVNQSELPEITLETIVYDNSPGDQWITLTQEGEQLVKERWIWSSPNKDPKREGWNINTQDWDDKVPWGAPNIANSRRPQPHRVDAFSSPELQAQQITKLLLDLLQEKVKTIKSDQNQEKSDYENIIDTLKNFQSKVVESASTDIKEIEDEVSKYLDRIFPNHRIKLDAKPESDVEKTFSPFKSNPELSMGVTNGYYSKIENQGSGARRTLLWSTLKYLSDRNDKYENTRPHVLLLDEPEICLHPSAIREARDVLYELPQLVNWQIMITTHSPVFIDLSKDNTTIVRVERSEKNIECTTLYRPETAKLDEDDKKNLKLLNVCDPYLHEFFFGGKAIVVEGDTEYTAFSMIKNKYPREYSNIHIIRARGKGVILSVSKVLKQFSKNFAILHDSDTELTQDNKKNPSWGLNNSIQDLRTNTGIDINIIACKTNFEMAIFGEEAKYEKPYNALKRIESDPKIEKNVKQLLDSLIDISKKPPANCIRWSQINDLK